MYVFGNAAWQTLALAADYKLSHSYFFFPHHHHIIITLWGFFLSITHIYDFISNNYDFFFIYYGFLISEF